MMTLNIIFDDIREASGDGFANQETEFLASGSVDLAVTVDFVDEDLWMVDAFLNSCEQDGAGASTFEVHGRLAVVFEAVEVVVEFSEGVGACRFEVNDGLVLQMGIEAEFTRLVGDTVGPTEDFFVFAGLDGVCQIGSFENGFLHGKEHVFLGAGEGKGCRVEQVGFEDRFVESDPEGEGAGFLGFVCVALQDALDLSEAAVAPGRDGVVLVACQVVHWKWKIFMNHKRVINHEFHSCMVRVSEQRYECFDLEKLRGARGCAPRHRLKYTKEFFLNHMRYIGHFSFLNHKRHQRT